MHETHLPWDYVPPAEYLADYLKSRVCATLIMQKGSADDAVASLLSEGWVWSGDTEYVAGKRIRYLVPPEPIKLDLICQN